MLRVVERVLGEGDLFRDGARVLRAGYEMSLYQNWAPTGGHLQPTHFEFEGHLFASPDQLDPLLGVGSPLTLHLDDGRRVDVYVLNNEGTITPADQRGFYRE